MSAFNNTSPVRRQISEAGLNLIKHFERFVPNAYSDPGTGAEPITIGYGSTRWEDGSKVKMGQVISIERAEKLLRLQVENVFAKAVNDIVTSNINQNQFDALVSFCYNVGTSALRTSTLLKRVNSNPADPDIRTQFGRWNKSGGRVMKGLTIRRGKEADLYYS